MKKILFSCFLIFCTVFYMSVPVFAMEEIADYTMNDELIEMLGIGDDSDIYGTVKSKGKTDYHYVPAEKIGSARGAAILGVEIAIIAASVATAGVAGSAAGSVVGTVTGGAASFDPYIIQIDGTTYVFIRDNQDGVWDNNDVLGYTDSKDNLFYSLKAMSIDNVKVTSNDLKRNGVRLVPIQNGGKLYVDDMQKDYNLDNIAFIDLTRLKKLANSTDTGVFGHFKMQLTDNRKLTGYVTFNHHEKIKNLF